MEKGFFHPSRGYWQTTNDPSAEVFAFYPEGTVSVPLKPGADFAWQGGAWVCVPAPAPPREVQEALRQAAYAAEADPLFFKWQAGEATEAEWKAKREEIRARYPYPPENV
jgi:hypothetical protein